MAEKLLKEMSSKFKPSAYKDDYYSKVQAAIKVKTKSKKAYSSVQREERKSEKKSIDIMDLLAKSLKSAKTSPPTRKRKAA